MMRFHVLEDVDQRVLGALRFVNDVDGALINIPLTVGPTPLAPGQNAAADEAGPIRVGRNRRGLYVILGARDLPQEDDFEKYAASFAPPSKPLVGSRIARLRVEDPSDNYFPSDFEVPLPRSLDPQDPQNRPVFTPQVVRLLPSPAAAAFAGWSVWQIVVWRDIDGTNPARQTRVPVALASFVSKTETDANGNARVLGRALTEWRPGLTGERPAIAQAQVAVPGVPVTDWNRELNGNVITSGKDVVLNITVDTQFDPQAGTLPSLTRLSPLVGGGALPAGILSGKLDEHLEARERRSLHVVFNVAGTVLRTISAGELRL
jgi:hypothetical protein